MSDRIRGPGGLHSAAAVHVLYGQPGGEALGGSPLQGRQETALLGSRAHPPAEPPSHS